MAEAAVIKAQGFNPQNLANTLWAYGKLDHDPGAQLLDSFCQCILKELGKFSAQNTSNMLWAFARLGHSPGPLLLDAAAKHATQNVTAFAPQVCLQRWTPESVFSNQHAGTHCTCQHEPSPASCQLTCMEVATSSWVLHKGDRQHHRVTVTRDGPPQPTSAHHRPPLQKPCRPWPLPAASLLQGSLLKLAHVLNYIMAAASPCGSTACCAAPPLPGAHASAVCSTILELHASPAPLAWLHRDNTAPLVVQPMRHACMCSVKAASASCLHAAWYLHCAHMMHRQSGLCLRQAVKDCLWAFATLNHVPPAVFLSTSEQHCIATLGDFTSQNVANAMWAFQKLGHSPTQQLLNMVDDQACSPLALGPVH